ncbi:MAG: hypothetical protein F2613_03390, partial [Actinobacteria bacterium]|nr:hypothetical protein [Actinomycetota bacterium]
MATLLYKLGLFSARNAWKVIVAWIVLLAITTGLALSLGGKLTTTMSISGVPSQMVVDKLQTTFPDASRGSGQVVFFKESGSFTDADRAAITAALEEVEKLPEVSEAINPFTVQAEISDGEKEILDGKAELADAEKKIADGQAELVDAEAEIADGESQIAEGLKTLAATKKDLESKLAQVNAGLKQMQDAGLPASAQAELLGNKAQLEGGLAEVERQTAIAIASRDEIAAGKIEIADARDEIVSGIDEIAQAKIDLAIGEKLLAATKNYTVVSSDENTALATIRFDKRGTELEEG